ncbi:hypothetical protein [Cohnella hongkongensis]|uniref:hypothetical protein n=1 Tax=Cohnella hongkongensis TaxID=178337 RepID=UPI0036721812
MNSASVALTPPGSFTPGGEGPACDRAGSVYAVSNASPSTGLSRPLPGNVEAAMKGASDDGLVLVS